MHWRSTERLIDRLFGDGRIGDWVNRLGDFGIPAANLQIAHTKAVHQMELSREQALSMAKPAQ